jgi:hypothetical protein
MRRQSRTGGILLALLAAERALGGEPPAPEPRPATPVVACCPGQAATGCTATLLRQVGPTGGWCPYGGGLLRWWPPHCFPCVGAPDDYCRKPLPAVCWPPYPPYYIWGPPEMCPPQGKCRPTSREAH